jgi:hypothetical protein
MGIPRARRLHEIGLTDVNRDEGAGWIPCKSSNVAAFRWVGGTAYGLQVRFLDGAAYEYDADEDVYDDLFSTPSKGKFVHQRLKQGGYAYRKIG